MLIAGGIYFDKTFRAEISWEVNIRFLKVLKFKSLTVMAVAETFHINTINESNHWKVELDKMYCLQPFEFVICFWVLRSASCVLVKWNFFERPQSCLSLMINGKISIIMEHHCKEVYHDLLKVVKLSNIFYKALSRLILSKTKICWCVMDIKKKEEKSYL